MKGAWEISTPQSWIKVDLGMHLGMSLGLKILGRCRESVRVQGSGDLTIQGSSETSETSETSSPIQQD